MRFFVIVTLLLLTTNISAQKEADNWLFGIRCWLNFSSGQPQMIQQPAQNWLPRGSTTMSNRNGQLLYYASGQYVYNRPHQIMPGSVNRLMGTIDNGPIPVLTLPYPGHDSLYYLFYFNQDVPNQQGPYLRYAIINMKRENGLGDVVVKDQLVLPQTVCLKITAVLHCNKKDIWLIGHLKNSPNYFSILLTANGLASTPVYSLGVMINDSRPFYNHQGMMKAAPPGNKIASAFRGDYDLIELMDFNNQTGQLSGSKTVSITPAWRLNLTNIVWGIDGLEFSSSGQYLYAAGSYIPDLNYSYFPSLLYQFDTERATSAEIQSSRYLVDSTAGALYSGMQLANNGKLYLISAAGNKLHGFQDADQPGAAAGFTKNIIDFGNSNTQFDLPYFLPSYFRYPVITIGNCGLQTMQFSIKNPVGINRIDWDFGDPGSGAGNNATGFDVSHIFSKEGAFTVRAILTNGNGCGADTVFKNVYAGPLKVLVGNDTTICKGDTLSLKLALPNANYYWNDGSVDSLRDITQSGKYWVRANIGECTASDTILVNFTEPPTFTLGNDTTICSNEAVTIAPSEFPLLATFQWNNGASTTAITVSAPGDYWLELKDSVGCVAIDTVRVDFKKLPQFSLGADTTLCQTTVLLNATVVDASDYAWSTGENTPSILLDSSGIYWADVTKDACTYRDSIAISMKPYPEVNLGSDTTLCEGAELLLEAGNGNAQFSWQNGSTERTFLVKEKGIYAVLVSKEGCVAADTIDVAYQHKPKFTLGPDQTICNGLSIKLVSQLQNNVAANYLWQDGSSQHSYTVTQPGLYHLRLKNDCGEVLDSVIVSRGICRLFVPTAFSPNGDGKNDEFRTSFGENIQAFALQVFNRWGQKVFESTDMNKGWNGRVGGIIQPQGVYVWIIRFRSLGMYKEEVLKGTMLLVK